MRIRVRLVTGIVSLVVSFGCVVSFTTIAEAKIGPLPKGVTTALARTYPGWNEMARNDYDRSVLRSVKNRSTAAQPQRIRGDFDGNGLPDYAMILSKQDDVQIVALRQVKQDRWVVDNISTRFMKWGIAEGGHSVFTVFLLLKRPGTVSYWPGDNTGKSGRLALKHDGIEVVDHGRSSMLYYWTGKGYAKVQTGD
jgi:hypothetical protein